MTLGQRIQDHRTRLGLSQEGLGDKLGVSRQAVSKWEADGAVPDTDKLIALSKLFGISLNELLQVAAPEQAEPSPAPARSRKRLWHSLSALFLLALVVLLGLMWARIGRLEARLAQLEARPDPVQTLDPGEALVADFQFQSRLQSLDNTSPLWGAPLLSLSLTAAQVPEDLAVSFTAADGAGRVHTVPGEGQGGGTYTAELATDAMPDYPLTLTATFTSGGTTLNRALVRILDQSIGSAASYTWETLWDTSAP